MGGGASQKSGKTRAAAAASVRATVAPAVAASPAARAAAAASPGAAALASPGAGAAAATTPSHTGPRRQASPGSVFARRERKGEVVASLRPEIELPSAGEAEKKTKLAPSSSSMEIDGDEEAEAAASAAAALEDLPRPAAVVELLTRAPPPDAKVLTDSLSDRAAFLEARVERFAAAFEKAAAAAASSSLPASTAMNDYEEDQEAPLGSAPLAPVGVARQTARGVFVGRVVDSGSSDSSSSSAPSAPSDAADAAAPPPRLDLHSASLEGSASLSGGRRARLDVSALQHRWRLFPGQVVAVVGACPAGHTLVASALLPSAPPPKAPVKANEGGSLGLKVVAAAGPFTAPGDVAFEALDAVLALAAGNGGNGGGEGASSSSSSSSAADAVILVGPFVDERHPSVCSGSLDVSFDELFEREVISRIAEWSSKFAKNKMNKNNRPAPPVVLLPSPRDVAAGALTSAFPAKALVLPPGTPSNIVALPNPATFRIGGLVFGATGHDVLRDLSASQAAGGLGNGSSNGGSNGGANANPSSSSSSSSTLPGVAHKDRMTGLAGALLEQGCFYPLYPPARGSMLDSRLALGSGGGGGGNGGGNAPSTSSGAPSSSSSASRPSASPPYPGLAMPFSPDVLLLPSDLAPFARVATAEAPPALRVDESGELVVAAAAAAGAGAPSSSSSPSASSAVPPPQPGVEAVAVNPGRAVTAGGGGGTAAVVILGARKQGAGKEEDDLASRCRVDIVRL